MFDSPTHVPLKLVAYCEQEVQATVIYPTRSLSVCKTMACPEVYIVFYHHGFPTTQVVLPALLYSTFRFTLEEMECLVPNYCMERLFQLQMRPFHQNILLTWASSHKMKWSVR